MKAKTVIDFHKQKQFEIILKENPMLDNYHTGIRSVDEIQTFEEAYERDINTDNWIESPDYTENDVKKALKNGYIKIYSSNPIRNGVFVTPSEMESKSYAGNHKVYSKVVSLTDVAWITNYEGQYAKIN